MSLTILDVLENAEENLKNIYRLGPGFEKVVASQVRTARILLEKGYSPDDDVQEVMGNRADPEDVPPKAPEGK